MQELDKDPKIGTTGYTELGLGLGITGANRGAAAINRILDLRGITPEQAEIFNKFKDVAKSDPSQWAYDYATQGHRAVSTPAKLMGVQKPLYSALPEARILFGNFLGNALDTSDKYINFNSPYIPKKLLTFRNNLKSFREGMKDTTGVIEHYGSFGKSPTAAYHQLMRELPSMPIDKDSASFKNYIDNIVNEQKKNFSPTAAVPNFDDTNIRNRALSTHAGDDLVTGISKMLAANPNNVDALAQNLDGWGIRKTDKSFSDWTAKLKKQLGLDPTQQYLDLDKNKELLRKNFINEIDSPTLVGHINDTLAKGKTIEQVSGNPHLFTEFQNRLSHGRMLGASDDYSKVFSRVINLGRVASRPTLALGLGLTGLGAFNTFKNKENKPDLSNLVKKSNEDLTLREKLQAAAYGGAALASGNSISNQLHSLGLRKHNPFGEIKGAIIGGPDTRRESFGFQNKALQDAVNKQNSKLNAGFIPGFNVVRNPGAIYDSYVPIGTGNSIGQMRDLDYIVEVGDTANSNILANELKRSGGLRYRALTDYGMGNFNQPENWLGGKNMMKVHDMPNTYDRFFVPGKGIDMQGIQGRKANIHTNSIAVNPMFSSLEFLPKNKQNPFTLVGMGGGAGSRLLFSDVLDPILDQKNREVGTKFLTEKRNILDDIAEATVKTHGPNARVKLLLASLEGSDDPMNRQFIEKLIEQKNKGFSLDGKNPRWANVDFVPKLSQEELGKLYATADNITGLPGSTTAELMAIKGNKFLPKVVNIIPDTNNNWIPKHWDDNADFMAKNFQGSEKINFKDPSRASILSKIFSNRLAEDAITTRTPLINDYKEMTNTMLKDVRNKRIGNLGKLSLKGLAAGTSAYLLGKQLNKEATANIGVNIPAPDLGAIPSPKYLGKVPKAATMLSLLGLASLGYTNSGNNDNTVTPDSTISPPINNLPPSPAVNGKMSPELKKGLIGAGALVGTGLLSTYIYKKLKDKKKRDAQKAIYNSNYSD